LDALDAYNKKLVKKIQVKGISVKGTTGTTGYIYFEGINLNNKNKPTARIEFEVKQKSGIKRVTKNVDEGFSLYEHSNYMEQYKNYTVAEINGYNNTITDMSTLFWTYFYRTIYINPHEFVCNYKIIYLVQSRVNELAIARP